MEIDKSSDKEFRRIISGKHAEIQEHMDRRCTNTRQTVRDMSENFSKKTEILEKNQQDGLELRNSRIEMKNTVENLTSKTEWAKERISGLEGRSFEITP